MKSCSGYDIYGATSPWNGAPGVPCNNAVFIVFVVPYYHGAPGVLCNNAVGIIFMVPHHCGVHYCMALLALHGDVTLSILQKQALGSVTL